MKKLYYLLLALPLLALLSACDDDDKSLPEVSLSIEYSGGTLNDGKLYVVQGEPLKIDALIVKPDPGTGKAALGQTTYFWDGYPFYTTGLVPFAVVIDTSDMAEGEHTLTVNTQIFQEGKSLGWGIFQYKVVIVAAPEDQPGDEGGGTDAPDATISDSVD